MRKLDRRKLLALFSGSVPIVTFGTASIATQAAALTQDSYTQAFELIHSLLADSLKDHRVAIEKNGGWAYRVAFLGWWLIQTDLRKTLESELKVFFTTWVGQMAKDGTLIESDGRLNLGAQLLLKSQFPFVPDRVDRKLFDAFATLAPKYQV